VAQGGSALGQIINELAFEPVAEEVCGMNTETSDSGYAEGLRAGLIKRLQPEVERALRQSGATIQKFDRDALDVAVGKNVTIQLQKSSRGRLLRKYRIVDKQDSDRVVTSFRLPESTRISVKRDT